jgi:hypothetical protein
MVLLPNKKFKKYANFFFSFFKDKYTFNFKLNIKVYFFVVVVGIKKKNFFLLKLRNPCVPSCKENNNNRFIRYY